MKTYRQLSKLKKFKSICLISHIDPDTDAISSMVVFREFLLNKFKIKNVDIFADCNKAPKSCLQVLGDITLNPSIQNYDCAIILDAPNLERLGSYKPLFLSTPYHVCIDHHNTNELAVDISIVEETSSTCEILYSIMQYFKYKPTKESKGKLFAGIITDTGNFSVGKFGSRTFKIASEYVDDIDNNSIYKHFFLNTKLKNMQVLALAIQNIKTHYNGRFIFTYISQEQAKALKINQEDYIGIINKLNSIAEANFICFVQPRNDNELYVSLRAKEGYNVAELAKQHNGGGHVGASAFLSTLSIEEIEALLTKELASQLSKPEPKIKNIF